MAREKRLTHTDPGRGFPAKVAGETVTLADQQTLLEVSDPENVRIPTDCVSYLCPSTKMIFV